MGTGYVVVPCYEADDHDDSLFSFFSLLGSRAYELTLRCPGYG